jgi:hypothetical protein
MSEMNGIHSIPKATGKFIQNLGLQSPRTKDYLEDVDVNDTGVQSQSNFHGM